MLNGRTRHTPDIPLSGRFYAALHATYFGVRPQDLSYLRAPCESCKTVLSKRCFLDNSV